MDVDDHTQRTIKAVVLSGGEIIELLKRQGSVGMDAGYQGRGRNRVENVLGLSVEVVHRPPKPTPEKIARIWAEEWAKEAEKIDCQRLMPPRGLRVLPRRRVVERTFLWLSQNRRMSKDYERLCATAEAFVYSAMSRLMVRRLLRTQPYFACRGHPV